MFKVFYIIKMKIYKFQLFRYRKFYKVFCILVLKQDIKLKRQMDEKKLFSFILILKPITKSIKYY